MTLDDTIKLQYVVSVGSGDQIIQILINHYPSLPFGKTVVWIFQLGRVYNTVIHSNPLKFILPQVIDINFTPVV
jgi:hypothetical protein